ncbi:MAG TPA: hypothetical protein VJG32_18010 [Anaerolineae bacterium]|nr:hypothetical protein [Anaerolineae bacterium]
MSIATNGLKNVEIGGCTYRLLKRLGWQEQQRINDSVIRVMIDGRALQSMKTIEDLSEVEMRIDNVKMNTLRLEGRLQGMTRQQVKDIPDAHVALLIEEIEALEREQQAEIEALRPKSPASPESAEPESQIT